MRTRAQCIADHIAKAIVRNKSKRRYSSLLADAIGDYQMSNTKTCTTTGLQVGDTEATRIPLGRDEMNRTNPSQPAIAAGKTQTREASATITSLMGVTSQVPAPKAVPVDFRTVEGCYAGDHRVRLADIVKSSLDSATGINKGVRDQMAGQQNSRSYREDGKAFESTSNSPDSDQGN
jgi:hypothetical protein